MKRIAEIFKIKTEERILSAVVFLIFGTLHAINLSVIWGELTITSKRYLNLAITKFHLSGFDPLTYVGITDWTTVYNIYRHPLLAFFIWPFAMLNKGIIALTGFNAAIIITALITLFCTIYSSIFIYRIMREVIGLKRKESYVFVALTFSFAYIMLAAFAPDHFIMSMFALTLTLYIAGKKLKRGSALNMWQTIGLFILTAGISLNNGLKVFLAALVTRRKRFFEWKFLLFSVVLPCAIIWGFARWEYSYFEAPKYKVRMERKKRLNDQFVSKIRSDVTDTISVKDSALIEKEVKRIVKERAIAKKRRDDKRAVVKNSGKPIMKGEFMNWTDATTSRWDTAVENLFGEGIQLHEKYLLADVLVNRPLLVRYINWFCYIAEAIIVMLFLVGIWMGRKNRFLWTALSFMLMDMAVHMGLGFGINEIYIMSAHYLFVIPIAIACYINAINSDKHRKYAMYGIALLAAWCWIWNIVLLMEHYFM